VGKPALVPEAARGAEWQLVGLEVEWDSLERLYAEVGLPPRLPTTAWRTSAPVYVDGTQVGYATSGCWSPVLEQYLALAHVRGARGRSGRHGGSVPRLQVFDVLLRRQPAAAGDHPRPRPPRARAAHPAAGEHAHADGERRLPRRLGRPRRDPPRAVPPLPTRC